ncbi:Fic family protein [Yaniella flava]|uniref:Fic family protein n=2 Tax=Yaniella flava TaxID=287930 RepID=A0ABP5GDE6_9MICC
MSWSPEAPYNDLPPIPPAQNLETVSVLKKLVTARAELSGLNEALVSLPNPSVFVNSLALLEAQASSEIENIVTTTDELFRADTHRADASAATREALRYKIALFHGQERMRQRADLMTVGMAKEICSEIRGTETDIRQGEGTYIGNPVTGRRIYTPPVGRQVIEEKLQNWEQFMNAATDLDPLVQMAVAHYQFEAIHPFDDGNGRTGRVINGLMLVAKELLREPILYVSQYIIQHKNEYYRLLNAVTKSGAWEKWIIYMLHAVEATARSTRLKIKAIQQLQEQFAEQLLADIGPHYPVALSDVLFEQPYCRVRDVVDGCGVSRPTAVKYLSALADAGMLAVQRAGRENLYINARFMHILRSPDADLSADS